MENVGIILLKVLDVFMIPVNILGHEFSFWQVFVYIGVSCVILDFIMEVFNE